MLCWAPLERTHPPLTDPAVLQEIECISAPIEFGSTYSGELLSFLPEPENLALSDLAVHKYLGLAWYRLHGRL